MAMLSGAVAGILRVGAVALTAGGLATGIYFAVQAGQDEDANRAQTVQTPSATSTALSPPNQVVRPTTQPTPTYVLAPSPTAPTGVDTSDWKTYESPDGYSFKYPPDWTLEVEPRVRVVTPKMAQAIADGRGEERTAGIGEFTAFFEPSNGFPVDDIIADCQRVGPKSLPGDQPNTGTAVTALGRRAVQCEGSAVNQASGAQSFGLSYTLEVSSDQVLVFGGYAVPEGNVSFATLEAIVRSFVLTEKQ